MTTHTYRVVMNGITGRMGYRQHLLRSVLAIRDDGGIALPNGDRLQVEPIIVGRDRERLARIAAALDIAEYTDDLGAAIADDSAPIFFDAAVTSARVDAIASAIDAGRHVYTEKPLAENVADAQRLAEQAESAGITHGVVHDKNYLPGLMKLKRLIDAGFFGRILSVRGEFGYWVFEGDVWESQRPSWNYRAADGGGIVLDMFPHWNYVIENLFGRVDSVYARAITHIDRRWDESGAEYVADADDAAYAIFEVGDMPIAFNSSWAVRPHREELVQIQVDGTHGSAVAGLFNCHSQSRVNTPKPVWNPDEPIDLDLLSHWHEVPDHTTPRNGFRVQWEEFLTDVHLGRKHRFDFASATRGMRLVEAGLTASAEGRRVDLAHEATA